MASSSVEIPNEYETDLVSVVGVYYYVGLKLNCQDQVPLFRSLRNFVYIETQCCLRSCQLE